MPTRLSCFTEEQEDAIRRMIRKEVKKIAKEKEDEEQKEREDRSSKMADYNRKLIHMVHLHHIGSEAKKFVVKLKKKYDDKLWAIEAASDTADMAGRITRAVIYKYPTIVLVQESLADDLNDKLQELQCYSLHKCVKIFQISPDVHELELMRRLENAAKELIKMLPPEVE